MLAPGGPGPSSCSAAGMLAHGGRWCEGEDRFVLCAICWRVPGPGTYSRVLRIFSRRKSGKRAPECHPATADGLCQGLPGVKQQTERICPSWG